MIYTVISILILIASVLVDVVLAGCGVVPGVDPHDNTLYTEAVSKTGD